MKFVMELHGCDGVRGRRERGGEGFVYLMITYITSVYTISATGFWDVGLQKKEKEGEFTNMIAIPLSFKYYDSLLIW